MGLNDHIHILTSEHMTLTDAGEYVKAAPLLAELRAASGSSLGAQGGGSGGGGLIVNSKAVKLENEIKAQVLSEHFEMTGHEYRGNFIELLRAWSVAASSEWRPYLEGITLEWIDKIRELLAAKRPPWRPSIPCPACGQRFHGAEREPCLAVYHWDNDADMMAPPAKWIAECEGCGAEWNGANLKWLRAASDTPTRDVVHVG
jgi:hypothetical protein